MRKSGDQDISSLDMLLDTMCNTFGGIVFIALLIAIISTSLSKQEMNTSREKNATITEVDSNIEVSRLVREQKELQSAINHMEATLTKTAQERGSPGNELAALAMTNEAIRIELESLEKTNAVLASAITETEDATKRNTTTESDLRTQIANLSDDLREKRQESIRAVRLPRIHQIAGKRPVFIIIKDGKFYTASALPKIRNAGGIAKFDSEDVAVEEGPSMFIIEARKNAGQRVKAECEQQGKMAQALVSMDPKEHFPSFHVDANSFAEFNYVKILFVNKGFDYNWDLLEGALQLVQKSTPYEAQ